MLYFDPNVWKLKNLKMHIFLLERCWKWLCFIVKSFFYNVYNQQFLHRRAALALINIIQLLLEMYISSLEQCSKYLLSQWNTAQNVYIFICIVQNIYFSSDHWEMVRCCICLWMSSFEKAGTVQWSTSGNIGELQSPDFF